MSTGLVFQLLKTFVFQSDEVLLILHQKFSSFFNIWTEWRYLMWSSKILFKGWNEIMIRVNIIFLPFMLLKIDLFVREETKINSQTCFPIGLRIKLLVVCCYQSLFWWQRQIRLVEHKSVCEILLWRRNYIIQTFHWQFLAFVREDRGHRMEEIRKHL